MDADQEPLEFEPWALPGADSGVGGSADSGGAHAGLRGGGFAAPHGPHSCSGCSAIWTGARAAHCSACHQTFATVGLFDAHRSIAGDCGSCRDPATLTYRTAQGAGERVMFWRDGLWWAPSDEEKVAAFGERLS
jgi:hypothetical protein